MYVTQPCLHNWWGYFSLLIYSSFFIFWWMLSVISKSNAAGTFSLDASGLCAVLRDRHIRTSQLWNHLGLQHRFLYLIKTRKGWALTWKNVDRLQDWLLKWVGRLVLNTNAESPKSFQTGNICTKHCNSCQSCSLYFRITDIVALKTNMLYGLLSIFQKLNPSTCIVSHTTWHKLQFFFLMD